MRGIWLAWWWMCSDTCTERRLPWRACWLMRPMRAAKLASLCSWLWRCRPLQGDDGCAARHLPHRLGGLAQLLRLLALSGGFCGDPRQHGGELIPAWVSWPGSR
jgi:hypothetical protein